MCVTIYEWALQNFTASGQMLVVIYELPLTNKLSSIIYEGPRQAFQFVNGFRQFVTHKNFEFQPMINFLIFRIIKSALRAPRTFRREKCSICLELDLELD